MVREFFRVVVHGLGFLGLMALLLYFLGFGGLTGGLLFYVLVEEIYHSGRKKPSGEA